MAIEDPALVRPRAIPQDELRRLGEQLHEALGVPYDPTATAEQVQKLMLEEGIRPEDNFLSSEIIRERYRGETDGSETDLG